MIVANKEGLSPKNYRKFNIRYNNRDTEVSKIDDYYMMEEVLHRRLKSLTLDNKVHPDIIIIDGGRGQYEIVKKIIIKLKLKTIKLLAISKGKNRKIQAEKSFT